MIPKVIHYCWIGDAPLSELAKACIDSWHKIMPDYKIIEWNNGSFDYTQCQFACKAFNAKKWAFVADYFRAWVLYNHGGIYLDTDVKVLKPFDSFLSDKFFIGFEDIDVLEADTIGCEAGHPFAKAILDSFESTEFDISSVQGVHDVCTMPKRITKTFLQRYNVKRFYNKKIFLDDIKLYPKTYFSPIEFVTRKRKITKDTVSVHLFNGSWTEHPIRKVSSVKNGLKKIIKKSMYFTLGYKATQKMLYGRKNGQ